MNETGTTSILLVGVGGQGIVLASSLLATVCLAAGHEVKQSEVHGMAQRGGSVSSHVRFGICVHSPTIPRGEADYLVGFELLETGRWLDYLAPAGTVLTSTQRLDPLPVASGAAVYPADLSERIRARAAAARLLDALEIARQAGSGRAANMVMLGGLARHLPFAEAAWRAAIAERVPPKTLETNWKAFVAGRDA